MDFRYVGDLTVPAYLAAGSRSELSIHCSGGDGYTYELAENHKPPSKILF